MDSSYVKVVSRRLRVYGWSLGATMAALLIWSDATVSPVDAMIATGAIVGLFAWWPSMVVRA